VTHGRFPPFAAARRGSPQRVDGQNGSEPDLSGDTGFPGGESASNTEDYQLS
jgi:hypothetical protein